MFSEVCAYTKVKTKENRAIKGPGHWRSLCTVVEDMSEDINLVYDFWQDVSFCREKKKPLHETNAKKNE